MRFRSLIVTVCTLLVFTACAGPDIVGNETVFSRPVKIIGTSAAGGEIADGISLAINESDETDVQVLDVKTSLAVLKELGIQSVHASRPENLAKLRERGWDAYLRVETKRHKVSSDPGEVTVVLIHVHQPEERIEFVWSNAWGGAPGSLADASMRLDSSEAAIAISEALIQRIEATPQP